MVTITMTVNGKRKYYRGATKEEAEQKRDLDRLLLNSALSVTADMTFRELEYKWYHTYKEGQLHVRSEETIIGIMDRYVLPVLGDMVVRDIKPIDIKTMLNKYNHLSKSTQSKIIQYTKQVFQVGVDNDLIAKIPFTMDIKAKGKETEEVIPLTDDQVETLLTATKGTRVYPFLVVLRYLGLRKGEALGLMWQDIDFDERTVYINRSIVYPLEHKEGVISTDMKTKSARRRIPMNNIVYETLMEEKQKSNSLYVFSMSNGSYLSESSFRRMWDLISYRSTKTSGNLPRDIDFSVHPHQLRHTCITAWCEAGLDIKEVQRLAGHATPDITMQIYNHYREEQRWEETKAKIAAI